MRLSRVLLTCEVLLALTLSARAATVGETVMNKLIAEYGIDTADCRIEWLASTIDTSRTEFDAIEFTELSGHEPVGLFSLLVSVTSGVQEADRGRVRFRIHRYDDVLVTSGSVRRNAELADVDLEIKRMEVTSLREQPLRAVDDCARCRFRRNLSKGTIVTAEALEPVPDIEVGREVSIVFAEPGWSVSAVGEALRAGSAGDYIRVRNRASGKIIIARVIDATSVTVEP